MSTKYNNNKLYDWNEFDKFSESREVSLSKKQRCLCNKCGSKNIIYTNGKTSRVCTDCGTDSNEIMDDSPEWNSYDDGKAETSRCGAPTNAFFPNSSLSTTINIWGYSKMKMLNSWGQVPYNERSLGRILSFIDEKCAPYKIPKAIKDEAKILYKNIKEIKHATGINKGKNLIIRGNNRIDIIAACLYFGSILQHAPRSSSEIAEIFGLGLKQITKGCRKFLEIMKDNFIIFDMKPSHGADFIERNCVKIGITKQIILLAQNISNNISKLDLATDHNATSVAAASILLACQELNYNVDKKLISDVFEISAVTIQKTYKRIEQYQKILVSNEETIRIAHELNIKLLTDHFNNDNIPTESIGTVSEQVLDNNVSDQISPEIIIDENDIVKQDNELTKKIKLEERKKIKEYKRIEKEQQQLIKSLKQNKRGRPPITDSRSSQEIDSQHQKVKEKRHKRVKNIQSQNNVFVNITSV